MQTKIITSYKKIANFIFHYLIFFVALVLAVFFFQRVLSQSALLNIFENNDTLSLQKTKIIGEFNKFLKQNVNDNAIKIYVLQGEFQTEQGFITSVNNLISYKGFVVPKYFYMYNTTPIKDLEYFSGDHYDINELENFVNTFVFTKKLSVSKPFSHISLPLSKTLRDDFNLSCIFENKISSRICNYYLNQFLSSFFIYTIAADYPGIKDIFYAISATPQKQKFCEGLSKYLLYANDQSDSLKELFGLCGQNYLDLFKRTTLFMGIQNGLENQTFEKTSYKDKILNEYKLLSYQQQIYQDFLLNKTDTYKITVYLDFVRELLNKNTLDPFYKDEIYRYHTKYLFPALEKVAYQSNNFIQSLGGSKISSLLMTINTLNEGEPLLGFLGLNLGIRNKDLIPPKQSITGTNLGVNMTGKIQKKIQSISYLTVEKETISNTHIDIIGYLKFSSPDKNETIRSHIIMEYKNDMLLVKNIELQNKAEMNDVIKNILLIQNFSIGELYSYISKNLVFYEQSNSPLTALKDLCPELRNIQNITLISCTNMTAAIDYNNIHYVFSLKNGGLENITLSDKTIESSIKQSYSAIIGDTYSLIDIIQALLQYVPPLQKHEGTTNTILVFEKIQQYLGIKANDIADTSGKILVELSLGGINFFVNYTLRGNTLGPWYFKDVLINNKPYMIQNLILSLDDAHQNTINSFVIDPLTTIKTVDLTARQNYNASQIKN